MFKNAMVFSALLGVCVLGGKKTSAQNAASQTFEADPNHAGYLPSEQNLPSLERDLRSRMKQIIAAQLALTETQEKKFWPLYRQYEAELSRISDKKVALIREYSQKDDMDSYFRARAAIDKSIMDVNLNYVAIFRKVLSAKETALFFRIDCPLRQMVDLQLEPLPFTQP